MKTQWTTALLCSFLALAGGTVAEAGFESLEAAQAAAREQNKPLLLDFYTEW